MLDLEARFGDDAVKLQLLWYDPDGEFGARVQRAVKRYHEKFGRPAVLVFIPQDRKEYVGVHNLDGVLVHAETSPLVQPGYFLVGGVAEP